MINIVISISKPVKVSFYYHFVITLNMQVIQNGFVYPSVTIAWTYPARWMGLKWLVFLIKTLYVIGMWFSEDQRASIIKTLVQK